jgi:hypothetical protein
MSKSDFRIVSESLNQKHQSRRSMKRLHLNLRALVLIASLAALLLGCVTISTYSEAAYRQATSLKIDALNLMDKAVEPFDQHREEVSALRSELEKAYEYNRGRPDNQLSTKQWEILKDSSRNLIGGFLRKWETDKTLSATFIVEIKSVVSDAFDQVAWLESGKLKPKNFQLQGSN